MISALRKNFNLCNVLARILFVVTYVLSHWQLGLAATLQVLGETNWLLAVVTLAVLGTAWMFLLPVLVKFLLNTARIVSVPLSEFTLFAHLFCSLAFVVLGLLNLVNLFTPLLVVWGQKLFPFVAALVASVAFYATTSKLYFNDATRPHYFKMFAIYFLVFVLVIEVL